jgi:hypothetical protein
MKKRSIVVAGVAVLVLAAGVILAPVTLFAGDAVPIKATVITTGATVQPGVFPVLAVITSTGEGTSSHLGKLTTSGVVTLTWTTGGVKVTGTATTVAANGDKLYNTLEGWSVGEGALDGSFVITGGTGRFEGATGSGSVTSSVDDDGVQTAVYVGTISYKKK